MFFITAKNFLCFLQPIFYEGEIPHQHLKIIRQQLSDKKLTQNILVGLVNVIYGQDR